MESKEMDSANAAGVASRNSAWHVEATAIIFDVLAMLHAPEQRSLAAQIDVCVARANTWLPGLWITR